MSDIQLIPYLNFAGNCEEALQVYSSILGGNVEIVSRYNEPSMHAPGDYKNKVLHARLQFGSNIIMASDVFPGGNTTRGGADTALSLSLKDEKDATEIFSRLAEGGKVGVPFQKQFWGDWHGNLTDRFGIRWMVNC